MKAFLTFAFLTLASSTVVANVVNQNSLSAEKLIGHHRRLVDRKSREDRNLGLINGNTLGLVMGGVGVGLSQKDRGAQRRKLASTLNMVKSQFYRAQVLSQRNKQLYKDMDAVLVSLEDKIEDMGDDVYQKLSDFDNSVKSRLTGRTFLPSFSSLH